MFLNRDFNEINRTVSVPVKFPPSIINHIGLLKCTF